MNFENIMKRPVTEDQILYDSIYRKCPEWTNPQRQNIGYVVARDWEKWGMENDS